jgi:chromosome segregation protein
MRLRKIKLSGFKSFVDPTILIVPANLVGIVGPNGCGKSNIIDAVMWVMGESSAKHLRGDALTDVIFNGSSTRNPVGQASVELIFDNTEKKLGGQYASYDEISIKRQITRDAISTYFLNGTRCRRRDIQAIFLGTGLGPRSYAIIEQGMISRLIEARPEELRTFIEEAAGISKYRERRRETENRIRNTRDNIARLNDIREELGKQLKHLQRQAHAAERYQELKNEQRRLEAEVLALNWRTLKQQFMLEEEEARKQENQVEAAVADLRQVENAMARERETLTATNEGFGIAQSNFYRIGGEISQLEQKILHFNEKIAGAEQDLRQLELEATTVGDQQKHDENKLAELRKSKTGLTPLLQGSRSESDQAYNYLNESEQAMQAWQIEWESFNTTAAEYERRQEVSRTRLDHLETGLEENEQRQRVLQKELKDIDTKLLQQSTRTRKKDLLASEQEASTLTAELETKRRQLQDARKLAQTLTDQLHTGRLEHQQLAGSLVTLEALQQSALGMDQEKMLAWLKATGLAERPRLAQQITVEPEWTHAVETVLGYFLQHLCVNDIANIARKFDQLEAGQCGMVDTGQQVAVQSGKKQPVLADKVSATFPLRYLLDDVYLADSLKDALAMRNKLAGRESVITRDGLWTGINWARVNKGNEEQSGMLSRIREMEKLKDEIARSTADLKKLESNVKNAQRALEDAEQVLTETQETVNKQMAVLSEHRAALITVQGQEEQAGNHVARVSDELEDLRTQAEEDRGEIDTLQSEVKQIEKTLDELAGQRETLTRLRDQHRGSLTEARNRWQKTHEQSHGIALQLESISSQCVSLEQSVKRSQMQLAHLQQRRADLEKFSTDSRNPLKEMKGDLERRLRDKMEAERQLAEARVSVQQVETRLREQEQSRTQHEHRIRDLRDILEKARLKTQESRVWLQSIEEKLQESGHVLQEVLSTLDAEAEQNAWRAKLEQVTQKIHRLGPINLAAIDEFSQLSERKTYLDKQDKDLCEALQTLEDAIRRIDKESRSRFKETFDQLNSNLQELFPQLFGGGHAYLELTGDDLLETGVTVMARPPGKRISTIHLLSGGEKALTAVTLVFSIFKLNPAPFCILDEVDAPLDDTNVGRFSELVAKMSDDVQFIFITHNKITMEIAHQLLGVTMQEAGVSRLVTVDVEEAVKLAATA